MGLLAVLGGLLGVIVISIIISLVAVLSYFLLKTKKVKKLIPVDMAQQIQKIKQEYKEVENVRESARGNYRSQIPECPRGVEVSADPGNNEESRELPLSEDSEVGEAEPIVRGPERDIEEDWPEFE